jgi:hypothetical protein
MSAEPMQRLNKAITQVDARWQQQAQIDWEVIELMRRNYLYGQVWGFTLPACAEWMIVEGSLERLDDAR